jgi:hypothetical protein
VPELLIFGVAAVVVGIGLWLLHHGSRQPIDDEPQRLDVQNHRGDE